LPRRGVGDAHNASHDRELISDYATLTWLSALFANPRSTPATLPPGERTFGRAGGYILGAVPEAPSLSPFGNSAQRGKIVGKTCRRLLSKKRGNVMSGEGLLILLLVGLIAGWLAGRLVQGTGLGPIGDMVIGIAGSFIGGLLLPKLGVHLGSGTIAAIANATIGAVLLLLIIRLVRGRGGFGRRYGGNSGRRW
jgi:uncharacterized membrane protein YeaQ/YmgE (transglycosylase-associated protein family)